MHSQAFTTLEYRPLLDLIQRGAQTEVGRRRVSQLTPLTELNDLRRELATLSECVALRNRGINWSFSEFADPAETIGRLRIEGNGLDAIAILEGRDEHTAFARDAASGRKCDEEREVQLPETEEVRVEEIGVR